MSRARTNKENRPKRPSTLGLLLGGTGGRKDASKGDLYRRFGHAC